MPALTARKLVDEIQKHLARCPEAADFPVVVSGILRDVSDDDDAWVLVRVVRDVSGGKRRFILE